MKIGTAIHCSCEHYIEQYYELLMELLEFIILILKIFKNNIVKTLHSKKIYCIWQENFKTIMSIIQIYNYKQRKTDTEWWLIPTWTYSFLFLQPLDIIACFYETCGWRNMAIQQTCMAVDQDLINLFLLLEFAKEFSSICQGQNISMMDCICQILYFL